MDKQKLLPLSPLKRQNTRLLAGAVVGGCIVFSILGSSLLSGTIGNTIGNLNSPILIYTLEGTDTYISFIKVLPQFLGLLCLSILFLVNFVSVISLFMRKHISCMLVSLVIILGSMLSTVNFAPIQAYIHILPTTYINALQVITGELSFITQNANINLLFGCVVLGVANIILFVLYFYSQKLIRGRRISS